MVHSGHLFGSRMWASLWFALIWLCLRRWVISNLSLVFIVDACSDAVLIYITETYSEFGIRELVCENE